MLNMMLNMTAHFKNILWTVLDVIGIALLIAVLTYFIGVKVIWKNRMLKGSYSRKWMLNRYKRAVFKETSGVFIVLGYRDIPERKNYNAYDHSFVCCSDTMWSDAVATIIGNGDPEIGVKFERNDTRLRVIMIPCRKWFRPVVKHLADIVFSK